MPTVEDEPMASTFTARLARTARRRAGSGRRKASPGSRLDLQSGDRLGGEEGSASWITPAGASSCAAEGAHSRTVARPQAPQSNARRIMRSRPLLAVSESLGRPNHGVKSTIAYQIGAAARLTRSRPSPPARVPHTLRGAPGPLQ